MHPPSMKAQQYSAMSREAWAIMADSIRDKDGSQAGKRMNEPKSSPAGVMAQDRTHDGQYKCIRCSHSIVAGIHPRLALFLAFI